MDLNRTLSSIITVKMNLDRESHQFRPSASLINKSKSSTGEHKRLHKKTISHAPATLPNRNRTEPPSSMDKTAPVLHDKNATNCKLPTSKVQATASLESLLQMIIPLQPTRILIQLNRKANYLVKGKVSALCVQRNKQKRKKKVVVHKKRTQRLTTNKKKNISFVKKSQTANYAEFPKEGCPV